MFDFIYRPLLFRLEIFLKLKGSFFQDTRKLNFKPMPQEPGGPVLYVLSLPAAKTTWGELAAWRNPCMLPSDVAAFAARNGPPTSGPFQTIASCSQQKAGRVKPGTTWTERPVLRVGVKDLFLFVKNLWGGEDCSCGAWLAHRSRHHRARSGRL